MNRRRMRECLTGFSTPPPFEYTILPAHDGLDGMGRDRNSNGVGVMYAESQPCIFGLFSHCSLPSTMAILDKNSIHNTIFTVMSPIAEVGEEDRHA